jgi:DNA polymerase-1
MKKHLTRWDANQLLLKGAQVLSRMSLNGIRVDMDYCEREYLFLESRMKEIRRRLEATKLYKEWRKKYGDRVNIDSNPQLADILFNVLGYEPASYTEKTRDTDNPQPSTDSDSLKATGLPAIKGVLTLRKMAKARNTYLAQIIREQVDGFIHPFFKLHIPVTYRGSCTNPNFQNMPVRDKNLWRAVRRAIFPRIGRQIVEIDFGGLEVRIAACYHKDPNMIRYIEDPTTDMHRDCAVDCYMLDVDEVSKPIRYCAKNKFVFPEFYGDYWKRCAQNLWASVDTMELETVSGRSLRTHLSEQGYDELSEYEEHIRDVEERFWGERFADYAQWKKDWYRAYLSQGYFDTLTGFRCSGIMSRNDVINYPVQGSAFHCLLWCLIELQKWLDADGMQTLLIGQIHDSVVMDVVPEEMSAVLAKAVELMTVKIREAWPWIIVPLEIEAEAAPVDKSWYEKKVVALTA